MLNKLKFNNLVISNKKGIQQSRIQTINKLVHKIRKLKILLEKHPDNSKCKERIRKSTETMEVLKKLNRMDLMKQVLLLDKPAATVITNGIATPNEVAVALLSMNKVMQGLIKRFRTELQLNEVENDDWKQDLMESSKRKLKIQRTEEKRRKRLELKQQKSIGRKRQEWLEENQHDVGENISFEHGLNVSPTGVWQIEELSNDNNVKESNEENKKSVKESKQRCMNEKFSLKHKTQVPNIKKEFKNVKNIEIEEKRQSEDLSVINRSRKILDLHESSTGTQESLVVDPFFITDNGENYLSTAVIKSDISEEKHEEKEDLHMIKLNNYNKGTNEFRNRRHQVFDNLTYSSQKRNQSSKSQGEQESKWKSKQQNRRDAVGDRRPTQMGQQNKKIAESHENNIHPSWAAKQKLKPFITEFKGKKITFEENDLNETYRRPNREVQINSSKAQTNYPDKESLHPSWAAKQKMKPSIATFQGKKITFDENE